MAKFFERRNLPEGIVVVMLFSARSNSEGNLRFLGIGRWRRSCVVFPLGGIVLEFALAGGTGG